MRNHDLEFLKRFSMVIGFLCLLTLGLILLGRHFNGLLPAEITPQAQARLNERLAPVGAVYVGKDGEIARTAAEQAALAKLKANVPFGGSVDGKVIFDGLCTSCHATGSGGAPVVGGNFAERKAKGEDTLLKHAMEGFTGSTGVMPARGGNPALTDEQVKATVEWMMAQG